jgi:hypothetical protein
MKRLHLTQRSPFKLILSKKSMVERNIFSTWQPIKARCQLFLLTCKKPYWQQGIGIDSKLFLSMPLLGSNHYKVVPERICNYPATSKI